MDKQSARNPRKFELHGNYQPYGGARDSLNILRISIASTLAVHLLRLYIASQPEFYMRLHHKSDSTQLVNCHARYMPRCMHTNFDIVHLSKFYPAYLHAGNVIVGDYEGI